MSRRDDALRLQDMLTAARDASTFAVGKTPGDLAGDKHLSLLWTTVSDDLPILIRELEAIIGKIPAQK